MTEQIRLKINQGPALKCKVMPRFPIAVAGGNGITVATIAGVLTISVSLVAADYRLLLGIPTTARDRSVARFIGTDGTFGDSSAVLTDAGMLTIGPTASSLTQGIIVNQSGPTSGSQAGTSTNAAGQGQPSFAYNQVFVNGEAANITGGNPPYTFAQNVGLVTGGTNSQGTKVALGVQILHNTVSAPSSVRDHIAIQTFAIDSVGEGGTNTGAGSKGTLFGGGFLAHALSGATNLTAVVGAEFDTQIETGATAKWRFGCSSVGGGSVRGAGVDAAYEIGATSSSAAFLGGLIFCSIHGGPPIATTGTLIGTDGTSATVTNGIDFSAYTISGNFLKGPSGFQVSGAGVITQNLNAAAAPTPPGGTLLHLNQVDGTNSQITLNSYATASQINLTRAQATGASPGAIANTNNAGVFAFRGYDTSVYATGATIRATATETWGTTAHGMLIDFLTVPNTTTASALAFRINASGGIGVGAGGADPGAGSLQVDKSVVTTPTTVAGLPAAAAGNKSARMFVTDSNAASFTAGIGAIVAGGGALNVPVVSDGTNWRIG